MSIDDGLGFRGKGALVRSSAGKHIRRHDLPRFHSSIGDKTYSYLSDLD
jgi:hypothetical protein